MAFILVDGFQGAQPQPIEKLKGTNSEAFSYGQIVTLSSGVLTSAGDDTDGTQTHVVMGAATGDGSTANVPVMRLRKDMKFKTTSTATVAASLVGSVVTLYTDELTCTATTTKGCFEIDWTDGATTTSHVIGHFRSAAAI